MTREELEYRAARQRHEAARVAEGIPLAIREGRDAHARELLDRASLHLASARTFLEAAAVKARAEELRR